MDIRLLNLSIIIAFFFSIYGVKAQTIVRSSLSSFGNTYHDDKLVIHQTAGQSANTAVFSENNLTIRQGFQQPPKTSFSRISNALLKLDLSPNPNNGNFNLKVELEQNGNYEYTIINLLGSSLYSGKGISGKNNNISCPNLASGIYFVKVSQSGAMLGQIKFIVY
jgi:hypothetical protein